MPKALVVRGNVLVSPSGKAIQADLAPWYTASLRL